MRNIAILLLPYFFCVTIQECENNGSVYKESPESQELCVCPKNYIGKTCNITSYELSEQFTSIPIGKNYSFAYFVPTENVVFRFGLTFCSQDKSQIIHFQLYAQQEQDDNRVDIDPVNSSDFVKMQVGGNVECKQVSSSILISLDKKDNNQQPKIIFGLKQIGQNVDIQQVLMIKCEVNQFFTIISLIRGTVSVIVIIIMLILVTVCITLRKKFLQRYQNLRQKLKKQEHIHKIMPSQKYQNFCDENQGGDDQNVHTCAICLCQFQMQESIRKTPCGHIYHQNCLDSWCNSQLNCPICRKNFEVEEEKENMEIVNKELREIDTNIRQSILR